MISTQNAKRKCKDDISKIENYDKAIADNSQTWICHHRLELTLDGEFAHSKKELIRMNMYYNRPYFELIFLTPSDHKALHNGTEEYKQKMREVKKGKSTLKKGRIYSEFGAKFKEHFGITNVDDPKLYKKECSWYHSHNKKCRWE